MDGSGKGGWGVVSVDPSSDQVMEELCGPVVIDSKEKPWVGARRITNNTSELSALIEALENLRQHPEIPAAILSPDSEIAMDLTTGVSQAKANKELVNYARRLWKKVREDRSNRVWMRHVRGHRGVKWNERADKLADKGAGGTVWSADARWGNWPIRPRPALRPIHNRETERILSATDAFGVLNSIPDTLSTAEIENLYRRAEQRLYGESHRNVRVASSRLRAARNLLRSQTAQRVLRRRLWSQPRKISTRLTCKIDATAVSNYIRNTGPEADVTPKHKDGRSYGKTRRNMMESSGNVVDRRSNRRSSTSSDADQRKAAATQLQARTGNRLT